MNPYHQTSKYIRDAAAIQPQPIERVCIQPQRVNPSITVLLVCILTLLWSGKGQAQDKGYWQSASSNASAITGDVALSDNKLTINFLGFPIAAARTLTPTEVSAAFDADINAGRGGQLYHLTIPASRRFLHKNTLCGSEDTTWMATYVSGRTLQLAFFSGSAPPVFTIESISKSTELCGTFSYAR